ncbi:mannosyl-oligosaccharide glucosidase [Physcia stellaris]|nr:mannosyl-oligosaccharide glucosidase [Physcia stellaris]
MSTEIEEAVTLTTRGKIAIITFNLEKKLNALSQDLYYRLSYLMREIAARDDIFITILTGRGCYFSAGADVQISRSLPEGTDARRQALQNFVSNNLEITNAFYTHPKILITALNGPVIGLSAALISLSDFIYSMPHAFLLTPFTSLGLVAEGGASRAFVQRLGISKANEALIMSKRITAEEMLQVGFVNKIFDLGKDEQEKFLGEVLKEVDERLGDHLNSDSLIKVKALIRKPERDVMDAQNVAEVFAGLDRFAAGIPQEEFRKIASGEKRHKL